MRGPGPITAARMREKCTRSTRESLAHGALGRQILGEPLAQRDRCGELHDGVATVEQHREQAAETADEPQFSENNTENQPDCRSGARPTKIDTGTG